MNVQTFFDHLLEELRDTTRFNHYYKFHQDPKSLEFRKNYVVQRLQYILDQLPKDRSVKIMDVGCGYATTAIFLVLNGYRVEGITTEDYFETLEGRLKHWSRLGDVSGFTYKYQDLFDGLPQDAYDFVIVQDTLHHLEPIDHALKILASSLKKDGRLLVVEENGDNVVQNLKLIKQRGFKKVKTIYDERLQRYVLIGDENIRGLSSWRRKFKKAGMEIQPESVQFIRYYWPFYYPKLAGKDVVSLERQLLAQPSWRRKYMAFGLNFVGKRVS